MTVHHLVTPTAPPTATRDWDGVQFKTIFALSFPVYLAIAIGSRVVRAGWRRDRAARSILADACAGAGTMAQIAFSG